MLSRTADHLYWMARYMERAENIARILDVNHRMSMMPQSAVQQEQAWGATLRIMGLEGAYYRSHGELSADNVLAFMVFDAENPSSVRNCLRAARENAHAVRGTLTSELWETTNGTWLKMRDFTPEMLADSGAGEFFEWVKYRSHLSRGVTIGTMLQDESLRFIRLGTFLERADNTARILDVKYQVLLPAGPKIAFSGGDTTDHRTIWAKLDQVHAKHPDMVLMHGGSPKGAERIAATWANNRKVAQVAFKPDWAKHAKAAPFKRNDQMLGIMPIGVIIFPGTGIQDNLADKARKMGIPVYRFGTGSA